MSEHETMPLYVGLQVATKTGKVFVIVADNEMVVATLKKFAACPPIVHLIDAKETTWSLRTDALEFVRGITQEIVDEMNVAQLAQRMNHTASPRGMG